MLSVTVIIIMPPTKKSKPKKVAIKSNKIVNNKQPSKMVVRQVAQPSESPGVFASLGNSAGTTLGNMILPGVGGSIGGALGKFAGGILGKITGMGTYKINSNSLLAGNSPPSFSDQDGSVIVCHREFLGDISGTTAFTLRKYAINPGLGTSFPFLANIAANYERYELLGMIVEFKTTSAMALNSTNTALGVVICATNYDPHDADFVNKVQMESYQYCTSGPPCATQIHPVECARDTTVIPRMYIRHGTVDTDDDLRFYDWGNFYLATSGMQAAATIGELWVSYHVKLMLPRLPNPLGAPIIGCHFYSTATTGTATTAAPFQSTALNYSAGSTMVVDGGGVASLTFLRVGKYLVHISWKPTAADTFTSQPANGTIGSNLVLAYCFSGNTETTSRMFDVTDRLASYTAVIQCNAVSATSTSVQQIAITGPGGMVSGNFDVYVSEISYSLNATHQ